MTSQSSVSATNIQTLTEMSTFSISPKTWTTTEYCWLFHRAKSTIRSNLTKWMLRCCLTFIRSLGLFSGCGSGVWPLLKRARTVIMLSGMCRFRQFDKLKPQRCRKGQCFQRVRRGHSFHYVRFISSSICCFSFSTLVLRLFEINQRKSHLHLI